MPHNARCKSLLFHLNYMLLFFVICQISCLLKRFKIEHYFSSGERDKTYSPRESEVFAYFVLFFCSVFGSFFSILLMIEIRCYIFATKKNLCYYLQNYLGILIFIFDFEFLNNSIF